MNLHIRDKHEAANITICDKGQSKYHKILCINCQCDLYFAHLQPLLERTAAETIEYTRWDRVKINNKKGKEVSLSC